MDSTVHLYIAIFLSSIWRASSSVCTIENRNNCTYTVVCEGHAGSANNPSCDSDPNVNFIIKDSNAESLTTGFFGSTNFDSRVRRIKAIDNNWPNIESFAFKYYTKCMEIDLSNNNIRNVKIDAFKNLFLLDYLNLSHNVIEHLNPASLEISEISQNKLTTLDLSHNLLTEVSSESLHMLSHLKNLYLQNNRLTSLADDCFVSLKNLTNLNLRNNQLKAINETLVNLKNLKTLDLAFNHLFRLKGFELNRLESLRVLNMSYNSIEEVESNCFIHAFNLISIDLSNNKIKSPIENIIFINNNLLEYLNLSNNNIEHIQDDSFKHNALITLDLDKNNLKGDINGQMFNGISDVSILDLSNQSVMAIRKGAFTTATNLIHLNLSRNLIHTIEISSFSPLAPYDYLPLEVLDVSYNKLINLDFLKDSLLDLTELYVNNNKLTSIRRGTFLNQTNLKRLDLSMNFIVTIEQFSLPLQNLQYLNVTGNLLKGSLKGNVLSPSKYLRFLKLNSLYYTIVENGAFVESPLVARVNLSHNAIKGIGSNNFIKMENLYSLDLSYNKLTKLQLNNSILLNLKALYLNNNRLKSMSYSFSNISQILYLDISDNDITDISNPIFQTLKDLRVLRVSNNKLKQFNNPQTNSLTKLMSLSLSSNFLTDLNLSYFPDLVYADLSNNSISYIHNSFFLNLDHLQSIDLSFNKIKKLTPGTFQNLKILNLLNLSSNSIQNLRYGSFKGLGRADVIDLSRNSIQVLDVDIFHECTELKRLIIDYNFITQLDFNRLVMTVTRLNALSLGGNPISCKEIVRNYNSGIGRAVEVTSIDKVFEKDNVHGIWCGNESVVSAAGVPAAAPYTSSASVLFMWCLILSILVLVIVAAIYMYKRKSDMALKECRRLRDTLPNQFGSSENTSNLLL